MTSQFSVRKALRGPHHRVEQRFSLRDRPRSFRMRNLKSSAWEVISAGIESSSGSIRLLFVVFREFPPEREARAGTARAQLNFALSFEKKKLI